MTKSQKKAIQDFVNKKFKIEEVIKSYGFDIRQETDNRLGMRCPFHNERTGSFKTYLSTNRFHCFGCDASGAVVDFIMLQEGKTRDEILERFSEGVDVASNKFAVESIIKDINRPKADPVKYSKSIHFELRVYLREFLKRHPDKVDAVDECFREMRMFFFNPDNTDEGLMRSFSDQMVDRVSA